VDESNQSVAQELKTNESIAIQTYANAQARLDEQVVGDLVNSDGAIIET
jgi:hypothetical protein